MLLIRAASRCHYFPQLFPVMIFILLVVPVLITQVMMVVVDVRFLRRRR
jgi:hypothetical protein